MGEAQISFSLEQPGRAALSVYDTEGRLVRHLLSGELNEGQHSIVWDGRNDAGNPARAGVYYCKVEVGENTITKKLVLVP